MTVCLKTYLIITITFLVSIKETVFGQSYMDTTQLEAIAITQKKGFDAEDFIRMTKTDTSFYRAFKNLRMFPHSSDNQVQIFDKKWEEKAKLNRLAKHYSNAELGWIETVKETTDGRVYRKNGEHKYFTAEMYDKVFFPKGKFEVNNTVGEPYSQENMKGLSKKEQYYEKLKTFMFSPGTGVEGVPLIGKKLDIFSEKMRPFYDFKVEKTFFKDTVPCYKFSCLKKESISESKVVITKLITYYDRRTMNVIARTYALKDQTAMFSFDIKMFIELDFKFNEYLPKKIKYNGEWDVVFKKGERIKFEMLCKDYETPN